MRTKTTNNTSAMTTAAPTTSRDITKGLRNMSPVPNSLGPRSGGSQCPTGPAGVSRGGRLGGALWQEAGARPKRNPCLFHAGSAEGCHACCLVAYDSYAAYPGCTIRISCQTLR